MSVYPVRVITPEKVLLEGDFEAVILRTDVGDATFLAGHTPLVGAVVPGPARFVREGGEEVLLAVHGGFVHVDDDGVTVLPPVAELADDIDVPRAHAAAERAEAEVAELSGASSTPAGDGAESGPPELLEAAAALRRAQVRLEVAGAS